MIRLRPIGIGCAITLVLAALSKVFLGVHSDYVFLLSGFIGGIMTAIAIRSEGDTTWKNNVHSGFLASGLSGLVIFFFLVVTTLTGPSALAPTVVNGEIILFLTMSPLVIPIFATEGALGGLTESGIHALVTSLR